MSREVFYYSSGWCIVLFFGRLRWTISADIVVNPEDFHFTSQRKINSWKALRRCTTVLIPFCILHSIWRLFAVFWKELTQCWERSTQSIEHQPFSSLLISKRRELFIWKQSKFSIEISSKTFKLRTYKRLNKDSIHLSRFCSLRLMAEVYTPVALKRCRKTFYRRKFWLRILK